MNALSYATGYIRSNIYHEVLKLAFMEESMNWYGAPVPLEDHILRKVIRPRVLTDINLVGGQQVIIDISDLKPLYTDTNAIVYKIPLSKTNNREIISVLSIGYLPYASGFNTMATMPGVVSPMSVSDLSAAGARVGYSHSSTPPIATASVELDGSPNTIIIRDSQRLYSTYQLRCMIANDERLNNINPTSYLDFAELCCLAVKNYIRLTLTVALDQGYISGGSEIGVIKSYVESLSEADINYRTFLMERWRKVAFQNDKQTMSRFMKMQMHPGI